MPNLSSLSIGFNPSISGSVGKSVTGSDYKGPSQSANLSRSFGFTNANSNTSAFGADEFISYILSVAAGAAATVSLASLIDYLLQSGVSLARIKAFRFNLLSATQDATYGTTCSGVTINGPVPAPVQTNPAGSTSGGSIAAGTYYWVITATTAAGETVVSNEKSLTTTGSTSSVVLNWNAVPNATGYKIYRSTTSGTYGASSLLTTIVSGSTVTYTDTSASLSSGSPPTVNTAVPPTMFLFNRTSGLSGLILNNGEYEEWATPSGTGLVVNTNVDIYVYNNDASHAAALQITFVGGTT